MQMLMSVCRELTIVIKPALILKVDFIALVQSQDMNYTLMRPPALVYCDNIIRVMSVCQH